MTRKSRVSILEECEVEPSDALLELPSIDRTNLNTLINNDGQGDETKFNFLVKYQLIKNSMKCRCGEQMTIVKQQRKNDGFLWRCPACKKAKDGSTRSLRSGSFFSNFKTSISSIFSLLENWSNNENACQSEVAAKSGMCIRTVGQFYEHFRDITEIWMKNRCQNKKLGGVGKILEIDESTFYNIKYYRGRMWRSEPKFVIVLVERDSDSIVVREVEKRDADTLLEIIHELVEPGSLIVSDCWNSYGMFCAIEWQALYTPKWIDHQVDFVDPTDERVNTSAVKTNWRPVKEAVRQMYSIRTDKLDDYLSVYVFRRFYGKEKLMNRMLHLIAESSASSNPDFSICSNDSNEPE